MTDQPLRRLLVLLCLLAVVPAWSATLDEIQKMIDAGQYEEAEQALDPLITGDKVDKRALEMAARMYIKQGRYFSAASPTGRLVDGPAKDDAEWLYQGAEIARFTGEYGKAVNRYQRYLEVVKPKTAKHQHALKNLINTQVYLQNNPATAYEPMGDYIKTYKMTPDMARQAQVVLTGLAAAGSRERFYDLCGRILDATPAESRIDFAETYYRYATNSKVAYTSEQPSQMIEFCLRHKLISEKIASEQLPILAYRPDLGKPTQATFEKRLELARNYSIALMDALPPAQWPEGVMGWMVEGHLASSNPAVKNQAAAVFKKYSDKIWAMKDNGLRRQVLRDMAGERSPRPDAAILAELVKYVDALGVASSQSELQTLNQMRLRIPKGEFKDAAAFAKVVESGLKTVPTSDLLVMYFESNPKASPVAALKIAQAESTLPDRFEQHAKAVEWAPLLEKDSELPALVKEAVSFYPYGFQRGGLYKSVFAENEKVDAGAKVKVLTELFKEFPASRQLQALVADTARWLAANNKAAEAEALNGLLAKIPEADPKNPWSMYPAFEDLAQKKNGGAYAMQLNKFIQEHSPSFFVKGDALTPAAVMADVVAYRLPTVARWNHDQRIAALLPIADSIYPGPLLEDLAARNRWDDVLKVAEPYLAKLYATKTPLSLREQRQLDNEVMQNVYRAIERKRAGKLATDLLGPAATSDLFSNYYRVVAATRTIARLRSHGGDLKAIDSFFSTVLAQDVKRLTVSDEVFMNLADQYRDSISNRHRADSNLVKPLKALADACGVKDSTWDYFAWKIADNSRGGAYSDDWLATAAKQDLSKLPLAQRRVTLARMYNVAPHEGWNGQYNEGRRNYIAVKQWMPAEMEFLKTDFDNSDTFDSTWQSPWKHAYEFYRQYGSKTDQTKAEFIPMFSDWSSTLADTTTIISGPHLDILHATISLTAAKKDLDSLTALLPLSARSLRGNDADRDVRQVVEALQEAELVELAACYLTMVTQSNDQLPADARKTSEILLAAMSKNLGSLYRIPVSPSSPEYDLYLASKHYVFGEQDRAWELTQPKTALLKDHWTALNPDYVIFVMNTMLGQRQYDQVMTLTRYMLLENKTMPVEMEAAVRLVQADVALHRQEYDLAQASYQTILQDQRLRETKAGRDAIFHLIDTYLQTKNFDAALTRLDTLTESEDRDVRAHAYFMMAKVSRAQGDNSLAREHLKKVMDSRFADKAKLILVEIDLEERKNLGTNTQIDIGAASAREFAIPGEPIHLTINDPNLAIARRNQAVDVIVKSSTGDVETVKLYQSQSSLHDFTGQITPQLGKAVKGNNMIDVVGGGTVEYNIDERMQKERSLDHPWKVLTVVTNARLTASSGEFLTEQERDQRAHDLETRMRMGDISKQELGRDNKTIRPGNPIHVKVEDPDQGVSDKVDEITIQLTTKHGDQIDAFPLKETGPFTGIFQGQVPTSVPLPRASASDTLEGTEPGWVINTTQDGAWESARDMKRPKWFEVDIQEPEQLSRMEITMANDRQVKSLVVLGSSVNLDFREIGTMPSVKRVHGGKPLAGIDVQAVFPSSPNEKLSSGRQNIREALVSGDVKRGIMTSTLYQRDKFQSWGSSPDQSNVRLFGYFYLDEPKYITMRGVTAGGTRSKAHILIDGTVRNSEMNPAAPFTVTLTKGLHTFEVLAFLEGLRAEFRPEYLNAEGEWELIPAEWFSAADHPELEAAWEPAVQINRLGDKLIAEFKDDARYRQLRLVFKDFAGDSISIKEIMIKGKDGRQIVPAESDFSTGTKNQILEIAADDEIGVRYVDKARTDKNPNKPLTETLNASFFNGTVDLNLEVLAEGRNRESQFFPAKRVKVGDILMIRVEDWDMDVTAEKDVVEVVVEATGQTPIRMKAQESAVHSGVFQAVLKFGKEAAADTVALTPGAEIEIKYFDKENTNPGVGVDRIFTAFEAGSIRPVVKVLATETRMVNVEEQKQQGNRRASDEARMVLTKQIVATYPRSGSNSRTSVDAPLLFFIESPSDAFNELSELDATVISKSMKDGNMQPVKIKLRLDDITRLATAKGYSGIRFLDVPSENRLAKGMFAGIVRLQLGQPGDAIDDRVYSAESLGAEESSRRGKDASIVPTILVQGNDEIVLTVTSTKGVTVTESISLFCDGQINFVDRTFEEEREGFYLGESLNIQLVDYDLDTSSEYDTLTVDLTASGGDKLKVELRETLPHSGIFTGSLKPEFRAEGAAANLEDGQLSISFGETLAVSFEDTNHQAGQEPLLRKAEMGVYLGSDGVVNTFSKTFKDEDIAVKTAFTVAEAYFELAKEHRKLDKREVADEEIATGKRLLTEALASYPNTKYAAQAEYLLANLAQELAEETGKYDEAIGKYSAILQQWPDSEYAPKAQFKLAFCYEQMERWDQAVEEYVKITYLYPNNPLVANVIIRLGQYFWRTENYMVAGDVFKSFQKRFPEHALASKAMLLSGQSYIKAKNYSLAIEILKELVDTYTDQSEVRAEAMYWLGESEYNAKHLEDAYKTFKKLTWDYPETKWAKMARARLVGEEFARIEERLNK